MFISLSPPTRTSVAKVVGKVTREHLVSFFSDVTLTCGNYCIRIAILGMKSISSCLPLLFLEALGNMKQGMAVSAVSMASFFLSFLFVRELEYTANFDNGISCRGLFCE